MSKIAMLALVLVSPAFGAPADDLYGPPLPPPEPAKPVLFCPNPNFDWDMVVSGEDVEHAFPIMNRGDGMLEITNVRTSCGCQTVRFDKQIPPGGKGEVVMKMKTRGYTTDTRKSATVESNDPKQPRFTISMGGAIKTLFKAEPAYPSLEGLKGEEMVATVRLKRELPGQLAILSVKPENAGQLTIEHEVKEIKPGDEFDLTIKAKANPTASANPYPVTFGLSIETKLGDRQFSVPLTGRMKVVDTVNANNKFVVFQQTEVDNFYKGTAKAPVKTVTLEGWKGRAFSVTRTEVKSRQIGTGVQTKSMDNPPLAVTIVPADDTKSKYNVNLELLKVPEENRRAMSCEVVLHTDEPGTPEILLRVTIYFPRTPGNITTFPPSTPGGARPLTPGAPLGPGTPATPAVPGSATPTPPVVTPQPPATPPPSAPSTSTPPAASGNASQFIVPPSSRGK